MARTVKLFEMDAGFPMLLRSRGHAFRDWAVVALILASLAVFVAQVVGS